MSFRFAILAALTITGLVVSCVPPPGGTPPPDPAEVSKVSSLAAIPSAPFETVLYQNHGVSFRAETRVIDNANQAYATLDSGNRHPLPAIDHTQKIGILVSFGTQPTGMNSGEIFTIEERPDRLVVHPVLWVPRTGQAVTADTSQPVHYVTIPRTDKPIEFAPIVRIQSNARTRGLPAASVITPAPYAAARSRAEGLIGEAVSPLSADLWSFRNDLA